MNDHRDDDSIDTGEPIAELQQLLRDMPDQNFLSRLQNAIERRTVSISLLSFLWFLPASYLLEMMHLVYGIVGRQDDAQGGSS